MTTMIKDNHGRIIREGCTIYVPNLKCNCPVVKNDEGELVFEYTLITTGQTRQFKITVERGKKLTIVSNPKGE